MSDTEKLKSKNFVVHFQSSYETLEIPETIQSKEDIEHYAYKQFSKIFKEKCEDFEILDLELID